MQVTSGQMAFFAQGQAFNAVVNNTDDAWHHYGFSFTGSLVQHYLDGQLVNSNNTQRSLTVTESIGIFQGPGGSPQPFLGWCQDIAIYSGQLAGVRFNAHFQLG